jgi:hypothetical protein
MIAAAILLVVDVSSAGASSTIAGVWSFDGGQIAIAPSTGGTFTGTVVIETKYAECTHPVGQRIWTRMTQQPDGSYWGFDQWYFESGSCALNPTLGLASWRVLEGTGGSHDLRVCLSSPGTSQPTIAASGAPKGPSEYAAYQVTYGCSNSTLTAPLPITHGRAGLRKVASNSLALPSARQCLRFKHFKLRLTNPQYDPLKKVTVTLQGRKVASSRKGNRILATIDLKGLLPGEAFTIKIRATTVLGLNLSASRSYHTCLPKIKLKKLGKKG